MIFQEPHMHFVVVEVEYEEETFLLLTDHLTDHLEKSHESMLQDAQLSGHSIVRVIAYGDLSKVDKRKEILFGGIRKSDGTWGNCNDIVKGIARKAIQKEGLTEYSLTVCLIQLPQ